MAGGDPPPLACMKTPRIVAVLAAAALLLVPTAAHAATPGLNVQDPTPENLRDAIASGAKTVRLFATWPALEPTKGAYPRGSWLSPILDAAIKQLNAAGVRPIFNLTNAPQWANGSTDERVPPADVGDYARLFGEFVAHTSAVGDVAGYEVWNEPDEVHFWHPAPDAGKYAAMLKASYAAAKKADPAATVIAGPTTGNNYDWVEGLYANGAGNAFDVMAVHTDTACLVNGPDTFYRDGLRIARWSFLGYRSVHDVMAAHGDRDKPIWMTELGWTATNGGPTSCKNGMWAGQKPSGVSEADQARFLTEAYGCMANDPYVEHALWFTLRDIPNEPSEDMRHYGLFRGDGAPKPALAAFRAVTAAGGGAPTACADFDGPSVRIVSPAPDTQFVDRIDVQAIASDTGVGLAGLKFNYDGGKKIRGFGDPVNDQQVGLSPWYGSVDLPPGRHTIEIVAIDKNGNQGTASVTVEKVRRLAMTQPSRVKLHGTKVRRKGGRYRVSGEVVPAPGQPLGASIGGKVQITWQKRQGKRWKTVVKERKTARKPFAFKAKLRRKGRYRVNVTFQGAAPWKKSKTVWMTFKVKR